MDLKQQQKLHKAATKYVSAAIAAGGSPEDHRNFEVIDTRTPDRIDFQREVRQLRVALIADGKNPNFASRLARHVDAVAVAELHVAGFLNKPLPPMEEMEDRVHQKLAARQKLNELFESLTIGNLPTAKPKGPRP